MKIRPKIPMLLGGNNIWYNGILDYDPTRYTHAYDTSRLVNPLNFGEAWVSRTNGLGRGRYVPNPSFSRDYVRNIELNNTYYKRFTDALFNTDGTLSDVGKAYARLSDNLLPENSLARVYNGNLMRSNWTTTNNDTYGRPGKSFNNVKDYLYYERNDNLPGGRHNVFLDKGKRYFYVDNEGKYHWVSPEDAGKYLVSKKPVEYGWGDDGVYWEDYEITPIKITPVIKEEKLGAPKPLEIDDKIQKVIEERKKTQVPAGEGGKKYGFDWNKIKEGLLGILTNPNLYAMGRLAGNLANNERVYDEQIQGIRPTLKQTYNTYRQIVGDEATKQAYYRRATQGLTRASRPFTSDADKQMVYQQEAKRIGDELKVQGDSADNQRIRETSELSSQHLDANRQRATEVANYNIASINQANALKHNLLSLKHSALWSSIDNFLLGIEYRKRLQLAEQLSLEDLIYLLGQEGFQYTPEYRDAYKAYNDVLEKHKKSDGSYDYDDPDVILARGIFLNFINKHKIELLENLRNYRRNRNSFINIAKSGTKITHKKKDDLLYKSTKDVVEHFRKMSKLSSDALNRKQPKIEKLAPHPKGKTRRYLLGGVAPFTIYKPVTLGGETTTTSQKSTSSTTKSSSGVLDLMKDLFKSLSSEGIPSDVNSLYVAMNNLMLKQNLFGNEISSDDLASMYLQQMLKINNIKFFKKLYDDVSKIVNEKGAISEFAIDLYGRVATLNVENGKIEYKKLDDIDPKKNNPLTNGDLLNLRAVDPNLAFNSNILQVVGNATSMEEIAKFLKAQLPKIGSSEIEGYTKQDANFIRQGIQILKDAPNGDYKYNDKNSVLLAKMAINYLTSILPSNMKNLLRVNSAMTGTSPDAIIASMVGAELNENNTLDAVSGKAATKDGSSKDGSDGLKLNAATALITGKGYKSEIELNPGSSYAIKVLGRYSEFLKNSGENMGAGTTMLEATESTVKGNLDWNKATIGGSRIIPTAYNQVILNNGEVIGMDLPVDPSNPDVPDFETLKQLENLDKLLRLNNIEDNGENWQLINEICDKLGIPHKYNSSGNLNQLNWKRFAAFQVTTPDTALVDKNVILDMVGVANDLERELYNNFIQQKNNDKNFELSDSFLGFGHRDELYKGTVFVPIKESIVASAISSGQDIYMTQATNLELRELRYDLSKINSYKKPEHKL